MEENLLMSTNSLLNKDLLITPANNTFLTISMRRKRFVIPSMFVETALVQFRKKESMDGTIAGQLKIIKDTMQEATDSWAE